MDRYGKRGTSESSPEGSCWLFGEQYIRKSICDASYKPLYEAQLAFLRDESQLRILCSANRLGKTHAGMNESLMIARGSYHLKLGPDHRSVLPATEMWIGCKTQGSYKRFIEPAFDELCPKSWMVAPKLKSENWVDIRWNERHCGQGGQDFCRIWFVTYDMDVGALVGQAVDHIWFDEEPPRPHVTEALARIASTDGSMLMTFTPIFGIGWWFNGLWIPALEGRNPWSPHQGKLAERDKSNPEEFEVGRVLVPHFRQKYDRVTRTYRPRRSCTCDGEGYCKACRQRTITFASNYPDLYDRLIRIFGHVRGKQGLIYSDYEKEVHVIDPVPLTSDYEVWGSFDPGFRGCSVLLGAIDPTGTVYIVDELFSEEEQFADLFERIADRVLKLRPSKYDWYGPEPQIVFYTDTAHPELINEFNIQSQEWYGKRIQNGETFRVNIVFVQLDQGLKAQVAGFRRVQQYLQPRKENQRARKVLRDTPEIGEPRLYFFNTLHASWRGPDEYHDCSRILWEIMNYKWKAPPRNSIIEQDVPDKESAQGAHAMDALRYWLMARLAGEKEHDEALLGDVKPDDAQLADWQREQWKWMERELAESHHEGDPHLSDVESESPPMVEFY